MYAFVYDSLIDFPTSSDNTFDTITTKNVFKNVHKMTKVKVHLYHSQVTEKILGYVINFHNWRIRENKSEIRIIAHNLFGFDMFFFFLKGYRATAWCTKDIKCGGSNLIHINFANIIGEVKLIDTFKILPK